MKKILLTTLMGLMGLVATAGNIWTGSEAIDWNNGKAVSIGNGKFQNLKEGDQLVFGVIFTGNTDWPQIALYKGDWSGNVTGAGNTALAEGMTEVKYCLLKDMITDLKATGLIVSGTGFTLTSVDTPFSCMVMPYSLSALSIVPRLCVITMNCVCFVSLCR